MNRSDLAWALSAVLPHAGRAEATALVGLTGKNGFVYAFASDNYTAAVARFPSTAEIDLCFMPKEATELMRFVRPNRVAEHEQDLAVMVDDAEFHVGLMDEDELVDSAVFDTIVFDTIDGGLTLERILGFIEALSLQATEWDELILQPAVVAKFAKAQRAEGDRLRILPRHANSVYGAAVVTVGADFIGAIAGMTYDEAGAATLADFFSATERKVA